MSQKIAIVGVGAFGSALAHLLHKKGMAVSLWDKEESKVPEQGSLAETVEEADVIFLSVPSWAVREVAQDIKGHIKPDALLVTSTKGIEEKTLKTAEEILTEVLSSQPTAFLNGPMLAAEIRENMPAFATVATQDRGKFSAVHDLFAGTGLYVEYSDDLHGTALAGVLKNIYSIGLGMTEALRLGSNFRGWFVQEACEEMGRIIETLGGHRQTAYTAAGLADMVATGFSPHSRNCRVGHELVQNGECSTVAEGAESLPQMLELIGEGLNDFPLLKVIADIVEHNQPARATFHTLLERF